MTAAAFVDTNLWYYALTDGNSAKAVVAGKLLDTLERPWINGQVVRELGRNLLSKAGCDEPTVSAIIAALYRDCAFVADDRALFETASRLRAVNVFSYWDSLIVAAALNAGCDTLYSEDMQHNQLVDGRLTIVNPFKH